MVIAFGRASGRCCTIYMRAGERAGGRARVRVRMHCYDVGKGM
jgi:hypothetical protein